MFVGRFGIGFTTGIHIVVGEVFLSETSSICTRGRRTVQTIVMKNFAFLLAAILCIKELMGKPNLWSYIFLVCMAAVGACAFAFLWFPESPVFLSVVNNDSDAARKSQLFYWPYKQEPTGQQLEVELHQSVARQYSAFLHGSVSDKIKELVFSDKRLRIPLTISLIMAVNFQVCGFTILSTYSTNILESINVETETAKG